MTKRLVGYVASVTSLVVIAIGGWCVSQSPDAIDEVPGYQEPVVLDSDPIAVVVDAGESPEDIGESLEEAGVIASSEQFQVLVAFMGFDQLLQAGEYEFEPGTPVLEAAFRIRRGEVSERAVTVIEGWRMEEVADAVAEQGVDRAEFIAAASNPSRYQFEFLDGLPDGATLNGYLFPATYSVSLTSSAEELVGVMLQAFGDNVPPGVREASPDVGLTFHEVLTLASIIEREAVVPDERPIMAQVFLSRLAFDIPLEADPTVQYAVAEDPASVDEFGYWKAGLTGDDLLSDSPYNTYQNVGLPPGPIANPGLESILAVLTPADTNYLYFVARPDGSHAFAETFEEHLENVEEFRQ